MIAAIGDRLGSTKDSHLRALARRVTTIWGVFPLVRYISQTKTPRITPTVLPVYPMVVIAGITRATRTAETVTVALHAVGLIRTDRIAGRATESSSATRVAVVVGPAAAIFAPQKHAAQIGQIKGRRIGGTPLRANGGKQLDIIAIGPAYAGALTDLPARRRRARAGERNDRADRGLIPRIANNPPVVATGVLDHDTLAANLEAHDVVHHAHTIEGAARRRLHRHRRPEIILFHHRILPPGRERAGEIDHEVARGSRIDQIRAGIVRQRHRIGRNFLGDVIDLAQAERGGRGAGAGIEEQALRRDAPTGDIGEGRGEEGQARQNLRRRLAGNHNRDAEETFLARKGIRQRRLGDRPFRRREHGPLP